MDKLSKLRTTLGRKRRDFARFDSLPAAERKRQSDQGNNPHDPPELRKAKKRLFRNKLVAAAKPKDRKALRDFLNATDDGKIQIRETGFFLSQ